MKAFRFLMMTASLLASAVTVHAQGTYDPNLPPPQTAPTLQCPFMDAPSWLTQYVQQSMNAYQNLRTLCASGPCCEKADGCCEVMPGKTAGCAKASDKAPAACCCAKACGCCESCKAKKDTATRDQAQVIEFQIKNITLQQADAARSIADFYRRTGHPGAAEFYQAMLPPAPPMPSMPMAVPCQVVPVHADPVSPPTMGPCPMALPSYGYRVVQVASPAPTMKHAHLVTPDLEAHCERMTHQGDTIILDGNVLLLCKKHAQPIRIEAQRVIVNMKDGTFTVESNARPNPASSSLRTSKDHVAAAASYVECPINLSAPRGTIDYILWRGDLNMRPSTTSSFGVLRTSAVAPAVECVKVEEHQVQVIRLRFVKAVDVANAITPFFTDVLDMRHGNHSKSSVNAGDVVVIAEPISNSILVSATPKYFDEVVSMVRQLDTQSNAIQVTQPAATPVAPSQYMPVVPR